jgi:transcription termination factor Rho
MYDILELSKKLVPELREIAKELEIKKAETLKKQDLIYKILDQQAIVATEARSANRKERPVPYAGTPPPNENSRRRGKRPRFIKPGGNGGVKESVISVSPDDLSRPETKSREWHEQHRKDDTPAAEKPDIFRKQAHSGDNRQEKSWKVEFTPATKADKTGPGSNNTP